MTLGMHLVGHRRSAPRAAAALVAAFVLAAAASAHAAPANYRGSEQDQSACMGDVFRLCFSDIPDERAIVACLIRSKRSLSPACGAVFKRPWVATTGMRKTTAAKARPRKIIKRRKPKARRT
jgi:hypothetical protein